MQFLSLRQVGTSKVLLVLFIFSFWQTNAQNARFPLKRQLGVLIWLVLVAINSVGTVLKITLEQGTTSTQFMNQKNVHLSSSAKSYLCVSVLWELSWHSWETISFTVLLDISSSESNTFFSPSSSILFSSAIFSPLTTLFKKLGIQDCTVMIMVR